MIRSFQFARVIAAELREGSKAAVWPDYRESEPYYRVTGRLDTGVVLASVEIRVWQDFAMLAQVPPSVWCREPWMRTGPDWHNSNTCGLCWVLGKAWCDVMSWEGKRALSVIQEGRNWLLNDVRSLIDRHYIASLEGLTSWPEEWPFWAHGDAGVREYERGGLRFAQGV